MTENSTVATRLVTIIKRGRGYNAPYRQFIGDVYNINPNDLVAVSRGAISIQRLHEQTTKAVESIVNINHELYLRPLAKLKFFKSQFNLDRTTNDIFHPIDDNVMMSLEMMVDVVNSNLPSEMLELEQAKALKVDTELLIKEVEEAEINLKLKKRLLDSLLDILGSLNSYALNGAEALDSALERSIGTIVLSSMPTQREIVSDSEKAIAQKVFAHIVKYGALASVANSLVQLAEKAATLIENLPQ